MFATERAALHGGETLKKSRKQRRNYASYQFIKDTNWTGALMGDLVEELGRPGMARVAGANGERLLANVTLVAVGSRGQRRAFDELDFLFAAGPAGTETITRYVSAKANPRNFKRGKDLLKVEALFRDVPTGSPEQLRAWLTEHTRLTRAEVETTVRVEVEWRSGLAGEITDVATLEEFRTRFGVAGTPSELPVELLAPAGFRGGIHELELTWNQVADVAIAAIRRYLDEHGLSDGDDGGRPAGPAGGAPGGPTATPGEGAHDAGPAAQAANRANRMFALVGLVGGLFGLPAAFGRSGVAAADPLAGGRASGAGGSSLDALAAAVPLAVPLAVVAGVVALVALVPRIVRSLRARGPPAALNRAGRSARGVAVAGLAALGAVVASAGPAAASPVVAQQGVSWSVPAAVGAALPWAGAALGAYGLVVLLRWRAAVKRQRAAADQVREWSEVTAADPAAGGPDVRPDHVLQWVLGALLESGTAGRAGVRFGDLAALRGGGPELAALSAYLAAVPRRTATARLVTELVSAGVLRVERAPDGERVLVAAGAFAELWVAAPRELRAAMSRDLAGVLGAAPDSAPGLAAAVRGVLREALWDRAAVRPGLRAALVPRLPARLRGGGKPAGLFAEVRTISRGIDRLASELRTPRRRLETAARLHERLVAAGRVRDEALRALVAAEEIADRAPTLERGEDVVAAGRRLELAEDALARVLRRTPRDLRGAGRYRVLAALEERIAALRTQVDDLEGALTERQEEERAAVLAASDRAALSGFGRGATVRARDAAVLGWARFMAPLAGAIGAFPGQAAGAPQIASAGFADYYGRDPSWVTGQWAAGTTAASGAGLGAALLGDRLIKNMTVVVAMGVAGSAALLVLGLVPAAMVFFPSVFVVGAMGVAGGLVRGRMDRYHPVAPELKDARDGSYETAFKVTQFVLPVLIAQGISVVGFPVTMLGLAVLGAALTAGVWLVLRGEGRDAMPRAPPAVWSSVAGALRQFIGTPHGLVRALLSIPLLTALTGLYATALGGAMVDQLVLLNDPAQAVGTTATVVSVLVTVRGAASMLTGPSWGWLKALLGTPRGSTTVSEARVLVGVTLLPLALALPAAWMALTPGLLPFATLLTFGSVLAAWARMPLNRWVEGATGASLNNTAKAGTIALGGAISSEVLGGYSTRVTELAAAGLPYADLVAAANLQLALLVVPVVLVPAVLAYLTAKLRRGTLDELRAALEREGLDRAAASTITAKLSARGLNDIGSIDALFRPGNWAPRIAPNWRSAQARTRRASVGLGGDEHPHLITALERFARRTARLGPSGARAMRSGSRLGHRGRSPPPASRPQRVATTADLDRIRAEALAHPAGTGVVLAPPGDDLRAFGLELRAAPGEAVLVMHADADGFVYPVGDTDVRVPAAQVSELVAALLPDTAGRPLNVCGCSVAADPDGGMRELALGLGMPVVAPRSTVQVHRPGRHGARVSTDGGWLRVDGDRPAESVPGPAALLRPRSVPGAQRVGPPGVRLPIAPRAPPVTAGRAPRLPGARGDPPPPAERAEIVDRVVAARGAALVRKLRADADLRNELREQPVAYVQRRAEQITGIAFEDFGAGLVADIAGPDAAVLRNVEVFAVVGDGKRLTLSELDFLVVGSAAVRYVSSKINPGKFEYYKDRDVVLDLVSRLQPGVADEALRAALERARKPASRAGEVVDVDVVWHAGRLRLTDWRDAFRPGGAEDPVIELIAPHGVGEGGHRVRISAEEVRIEVAAGLLRAIGEEPPPAWREPFAPAPRTDGGPRGPPA